MFLYSGCSTDGDIERVRLVGPIAPATNFCMPVASVTSLAAFFAMVADS